MNLATSTTPGKPFIFNPDAAVFAPEEEDAIIGKKIQFFLDKRCIATISDEVKGDFHRLTFLDSMPDKCVRLDMKTKTMQFTDKNKRDVPFRCVGSSHWLESSSKGAFVDIDESTADEMRSYLKRLSQQYIGADNASNSIIRDFQKTFSLPTEDYCMRVIAMVQKKHLVNFAVRERKGFGEKLRGGMKKITFRPGPIGMTFRGGIVMKVLPNAQAFKQGVLVGWTIIEVNGEVQSNNNAAISRSIARTQSRGKSTVIIFRQSKKWWCKKCGYRNEMSPNMCFMCSAPNPDNIIGRQIEFFVHGRKYIAEVIDEITGDFPHEVKYMDNTPNEKIKLDVRAMQLTDKFKNETLFEFVDNLVGKHIQFSIDQRYIAEVTDKSNEEYPYTLCFADNTPDDMVQLDIISMQLMDRFKHNVSFQFVELIPTLASSRLQEWLSKGFTFPWWAQNEDIDFLASVLQVAIFPVPYEVITSIILTGYLPAIPNTALFLEKYEIDGTEKSIRIPPTTIADADELGNQIGYWLLKNTTLTSLDVAGPLPLSIPKTDQGINDIGAIGIAEALTINTSLRILGLGCNAIKDSGALAIGNALNNNSTLMDLTLNQNEIGQGGAQGIGIGLKYNSALKRLDMRANKIGNVGAIVFGDVLSVNTILEELFLDSNEIGVEGIRHISEGLEKNKHLQSLTLNHNKIGNKGAEMIGNALRLNSTLTLLYMAGNQIETLGMIIMAECLKTNVGLRELDFYNNNIGSQGAQAISGLLKLNEALTSLKINSNNIGHQGAEHIGEGLKENSTLKVLYLNCNKIADVGSKSIFKALCERSGQLDILNLDDNEITDIGARDIITALNSKPGALKQLKIATNRIGDESKDVMKNMGLLDHGCRITV